MDYEALLEAPLKEEKKASEFLDNLDLSRSRDERKSSKDIDRSPGSRGSRRRSRSPRSSDRRRSRSPGRRHERRRSRSPYDRRRDDRYADRRDYGRRRDDRRGDRRPDRPRTRSPPPRDRRDSPGDLDKEREKSPELTEEEHEMRSVFVSQLSARVQEPHLTQFLESNVGPVRDCRIIVDRISRRSKGVGYVEFRDLDSVHKAIGLSGTKLLGVPVIIQLTEAERNRQASSNTPAGEHLNIIIPPGSDAKPNSPIPYNRLYVGSLHFNLTEQDLRQVFQPFGHVDIVDLHKDVATGKSKGYAFVQFKFQKDAAAAMEKMNNFPLAGRPIKVGLVTDMPKVHAPAPPRESGGGGGGGYNGRPGGSRLLDPISDDPDRGGNLSGISRIELMHKLSREEKAVDVKALPMWKPNIPTAASRCVLLKNMFDPAEETDRDWHVELREDVRAEVQEKYGDVVDLFLIKESKGEIYIKFVDQDVSTKALEGLNGRFFGGRRVSASYISDAMYSASKP